MDEDILVTNVKPWKNKPLWWYYQENGCLFDYASFMVILKVIFLGAKASPSLPTKASPAYLPVKSSYSEVLPWWERVIHSLARK